MRKYIYILMGLIMTGMLPVSGRAQSIWVPPTDHKPVIVIEMLKPNFDRADFSFATSAHFFTLRQPLSDKGLVVVELPFAHRGNGRSGNTLGNPYVGVEVGREDADGFGEFGVRVPLLNNFGDDGAAIIGYYSAFDRLEAFTEDNLAITAAGNYRYRHPSGVVVRIRTGPVLSVNIDKQGFEDAAEVIMAYSAQVWYLGSQFGVGGGFGGRANLTAENLDFTERTVDQFGIAGNVNVGRVKPGVHLRFPLDEGLSNILDAVIGIQVSVSLDPVGTDR